MKRLKPREVGGRRQQRLETLRSAGWKSDLKVLAG